MYASIELGRVWWSCKEQELCQFQLMHPISQLATCNLPFVSKMYPTQLRIFSICNTAVRVDFEFCQLFQITCHTPEIHPIQHG